MTASQQPDAEHAPLTSPAAAGSGSTGHDKAVEAAMDAMDGIEVWVGGRDDAGDDTYHSGTLDRDDLRKLAKAALRAARDHDRAALAAGDTNVAEALGMTVETDPGLGPGDATERRFVTDWTEA